MIKKIEKFFLRVSIIFKKKVRDFKEKRRERYVIFTSYKNAKIQYLIKTNDFYEAEDFGKEYLVDLGKDFDISIKIFFLKKNQSLKSLIDDIKDGRINPLKFITYNDAIKDLA